MKFVGLSWVRTLVNLVGANCSCDRKWQLVLLRWLRRMLLISTAPSLLWSRGPTPPSVRCSMAGVGRCVTVVYCFVCLIRLPGIATEMTILIALVVFVLVVPGRVLVPSFPGRVLARRLGVLLLLVLGVVRVPALRVLGSLGTEGGFVLALVVVPFRWPVLLGVLERVTVLVGLGLFVSLT